MNKKGRVLLITGPAGSGKSTLAQCISDKLEWQYISEDEFWTRNGWGSGFRSNEQEEVVQKQVFDSILHSCHTGKNVVLEFILYKDPPNPLTEYQEMLSASSITFNTIVLKTTAEEILSRLKQRGRASDLNNLESKKKDAENQIRCLESAYINPGWVIDSTNMSADELCNIALKFQVINSLP